MAFRFAYESRFRSRWDRDEATDLVVVLRAENHHDLATLPYDLGAQSGRQLSFDLGESCFPISAIRSSPRSTEAIIATRFTDRAWKRDMAGQAWRRRDEGFRASPRLPDHASAHQAPIRPVARPVAETLPGASLLPRLLDDRLDASPPAQQRNSTPGPLRPSFRTGHAFFCVPAGALATVSRSHCRERQATAYRMLSAARSGFEIDGSVHIYPSTTTMSASISTTCSLKGMLSPRVCTSATAMLCADEWAAVGSSNRPRRGQTFASHPRPDGEQSATRSPVPKRDTTSGTAFAYRWAELGGSLVGGGHCQRARSTGPTDCRTSRWQVDRSILRLDRAPLRGASQSAARPAGDGPSRCRVT